MLHKMNVEMINLSKQRDKKINTRYKNVLTKI